jgi:hypothetical protein
MQDASGTTAVAESTYASELDRAVRDLAEKNQQLIAALVAAKRALELESKARVEAERRASEAEARSAVLAIGPPTADAPDTGPPPVQTAAGAPITSDMTSDPRNTEQRNANPAKSESAIFAAAAASRPKDQTSSQGTESELGTLTLRLGSRVRIEASHVPELSDTFQVGGDGALHLPLVGNVAAVGRKPEAVASDVERLLSPFVVRPQIRMIVEGGIGNEEAAGDAAVRMAADVAEPAATATTKKNPTSTSTSAGAVASSAETPTPAPTTAPTPEATARRPSGEPSPSPAGEKAMTMPPPAMSMVVSQVDAARRWRIGASGAVEASMDGGSTWQSQATVVDAELVSGSAPSNTVCWMVGRSGTVIRTLDGGNTWEKLSFPESSDLRAVFAKGAAIATVTTVDGHPFMTRNGGRSWQGGS